MISDLTVEQWNTVLNQDLTGFMNVVRATLPRLRAWAAGHT
jgi:NADP-dependent 3-hydroxy acid dehydrogenase YdfG